MNQYLKNNLHRKLLICPKCGYEWFSFIKGNKKAYMCPLCHCHRLLDRFEKGGE